MTEERFVMKRAATVHAPTTTALMSVEDGYFEKSGHHHCCTSLNGITDELAVLYLVG